MTTGCNGLTYMLFNKRRQAWAYIDRIRNPDKRAYAAAYYNYLRGFKHAPERPIALSVMAAQAVEMRLIEFLKI